ncbi:hypothetical protein CWE09_13800 [Aliidiomarina minuta]|uniref:DUF3261 domain-containing protein n=1 Tax=Aliidiomarina minuta TaxID=880057 RepID=A0A432W195_9GAMM|nr:hypothetical protein [Aliidiomarina minuta]RUO23000.1 hypothetical protein CWE09_13800 [Aliidiomarina minuta]
MPVSALSKLALISMLCFSLAACSQSENNNGAQRDVSAKLPLQLNTDIEGIMLSGTFAAPDELRLQLATPLVNWPQSTTTENYSIRINDASESIPVTVREVSKGPLHFSIAVPEGDLPIEKLALYDNGTQLYAVEATQMLPPQDEWLPLVQLEQQQDQLCLTWPESLFDEASLLSLNEQQRLQLRKQSAASPLCLEAKASAHTQWRVNLRTSLSAVQLITYP